MPKLKMYKASGWAEHNPALPPVIFENDGDIHEVSQKLADLVCGLDPPKGEVVPDDPAEGMATVSEAVAEEVLETPATGPTMKAEAPRHGKGPSKRR